MASCCEDNEIKLEWTDPWGGKGLLFWLFYFIMIERKHDFMSKNVDFAYE